MEEPKSKLHVAMFPWLAFGHMIPFLELSKLIARKGHTVSFISTPRNISRLPKIPSELEGSIKFVALPLPRVEHLPEDAEATCDVPESHTVYLKRALDGVSQSFSEFLDVSRPDWIVYDFAHHWVPSIAEKFGVSRAYFSIITASTLCVLAGPPLLMIEGDPRKTAKDLTMSPPWIPFESNVVFRLFEAKKIKEYPTFSDTTADLSDIHRLGLASLGSDIILIRTCTEVEAQWIPLLSNLHGKPIVPTGLLPPAPAADPGDKKWLQLCQWLDGQPKSKLHVAVFPWLAFGHMIPFLELSKLIARKGHTVSFISTPRNISRLPKIPLELEESIKLVALPLPSVDQLPENAEATCDVPESHIVYLKRALDGMSESFSEFLDVSRPDWIVYDFAQYWAPSIAEKFGVSRAYFSIFNASGLCVMIGSPSVMIKGDPRKTAKDLTVSPPWIPFENNIVFRLFEAVKIVEYPTFLTSSDLTDTYRANMASLGSDIIAVKTCTELEPEWVSLLGDLHGKPIVPTGLLPPTAVADPDDKTWLEIRQWLDRQPEKLVIYVALGTEMTVTDEEIRGLAQGLELSGLPFIWAFRKEHEASKVFHDGFKERTKERGLIWTGWAPQTSIMNHNSVGGFLTHCGWGSAVEGLSFGLPLIMFPCGLDHPLVAKLLAGMNLGLEIPRNEEDGSFTSAGVAETIRLVVAKEEGKLYRDTAASLQKKIFGNKTLQDEYADKFIEALENHRAGLSKK